ncbi:MAG: MFS transporter [Clostridia bacterium]|nr:MFS transporter [Clostridia bacterium]
MADINENAVQPEGQSLIARASGLKGKDYMAYALGDTGCCLVFGLVTTLLQRYYTDVLLLHPLYIMLMFVVARIWDAVNDPIMGRICDTIKRSRWGRYRPWFLYGSIPLALSAVLMFVNWWGKGVTPGSVGISVYAAVTYVLFGMCYTVIQIPYGSLASVVTLDEKERSKLSIWRSIGAAIGSMPVMIIGMIAFKAEKGTPGEEGYVPGGVNYTILIIGVVVMAILGLAMLLFAFFGNKERVKAVDKVVEKGATLRAFKMLFKSRSMIAVSLASMLLLAGQMFIQSFYSYLINFYFHKEGIWTMLPTVLTYLPMAVLMFFTPKLVRKFGKKEVSGIGMVISAVANLAMFFLLFMGQGDAALYIFMVFCLISGIGLNFFVLQVWAMAADSIDEIEVKTGSRDDGTAYAFFMFFRKLGQAISAIAVGVTLIAMKYYDTIAKTGTFDFSPSQLKLMFILATLIPAAMFGVMAVILLVIYPLSKKKVADLQVQKEEHLRRAMEDEGLSLGDEEPVESGEKAELVGEVIAQDTPIDPDDNAADDPVDRHPELAEGSQGQQPTEAEAPQEAPEE